MDDRSGALLDRREGHAQALVLLLSLLAFLFAQRAQAQPQSLASVEKLAARLGESDWMTIFGAKWELESRQGKAIPALAALLERREVVKLTNTLDLIYPGAETFYGHGWIVNYDLDYLPARAGWVLEEMTFQSFGFEGDSIRKERFRELAKNPEGDVPLARVVPPETTPRDERFAEPIARARAWTRAHGTGWSRLAALKEALASTDASRQLRALRWLRSGTTFCDGLSPAVYEKNLKARVAALASSPDPTVAQIASYLLGEGDSWWRYKTDPTLREWGIGVPEDPGIASGVHIPFAPP